MAKKKQALAPFAAPAKAQDAAKALQQYAQSNPAQTGGGLPFLRLLGADGWFYGPEDNEIEENAEWAVNIATVMHGYTCWTDHDKDSKQKNEKVGEVMLPINEPLPGKGSLEDHGWDWNECIRMELACTKGADKGVQVQYSATSHGGVQFCRRLFKDIGAQFSEDPENCVPVIKLTSSHYQHKQYGRTYKPEYEIVGWCAFGSTDVKRSKKAA